MLVASLMIATASKRPDRSYTAEQQSWRRSQEAEIAAPDGWLSVVGLYWLHEGDNTIGASQANTIVLSSPAVPMKVGTFKLKGEIITFIPDTNAQVRKGDTAVVAGEVAPDRDKLSIGPVVLLPIKRGARVGIRVFDPNCHARKTFRGIKWFPINETYKVKAEFVPYSAAKSIPITNVLGDVSMSPNPGYVTFTLRGTKCRLEAQSEGAGLFLNFRDETSGTSTYPAGRFLYTGPPTAGSVEIDFNQVINPPCAYTAFATCPLPPEGNMLHVKVEAGEKVHHPDQESAHEKT